MQLSNIKRTTVGKNILVDENTIVLFIPSVERKIWSGVYQTAFLMSNCRGVVIPNKIFKFNKRPFNGRVHYLESKKQFLELKHVIKKIPVFSSIHSLPTKNKEEEPKKIKQFYFYDMSMLQSGVNFFINKLPEKRIYQILVDEIRNTYKEIKSVFPDRKVVVLLDIVSKNDLFYLFLSDFRRVKNLIKDSLAGDKFFDGFLFASINQRLIPTLEYDQKGIIQPIFPMIKRIDTFLESIEIAGEIDGAPAISNQEVDANPDKIVPNKSIVSKIIDTLSDPETAIFQTTSRKNLTPSGQVVKEKEPLKTKPLTVEAKPDVENDDKIQVELDGRTLSKVMRYYKVTNPDIVANVKAAIDEYIKETGAVPTKANAESLVLKAVSKSIHGTDEVNEIYLSNPNLLFDKLKEVNVFSVPLNFPKNEKKFPFDISDIVTLKSVTGQHRQKFEFTQSIHENIEKVFKILEQQKHPIKVLGITYNYIDNNLDRFTEYTVNLQNMDGNKQKYSVKLDIPTVINDKYFKIGGNR